MSTDQAKPPVKLCALWKRKSKAGLEYYGGRLNTCSNIFLYPNAHKKTAKDPDAFLYVAAATTPSRLPATPPHGTENLPPVVM